MASSQQENIVTTSTSIVLFRWIGYGLLGLFVLDIATLLSPLDLMNANWEFQTAGNIVERIPIPIIGLGLVFFQEMRIRKRWEIYILKALSWISLLFCLICVAGIPIVLATSSQRIAQQIDVNFANEYDQQFSQSVAIQDQIESASRNELEAFLEDQGEAVGASSAEEARQQLLADIAEARDRLRTQVQEEINLRKATVKKNAVKWILGSIMSGVIFAYTWHLTRWARASISQRVSQEARLSR